MTRKELLNKMDGKRVIVTYEGLPTADNDNEALKNEIFQFMRDNDIPLSNFEEYERGYQIKGVDRFWFRSRVVQGEVRTFKLRSRDFTLTPENGGEIRYCAIPLVCDMTILDDGRGFKRTTMDVNGKKGLIIYTLADGQEV